jgi:hypothetical protein
MTPGSSCSWCHAWNPATERYCQECGHEAHVPRMCCRCPRCSRAGPADDGHDDTNTVTTVGEALDDVLAELLRRRAAGQ